MFKSRQRTCQKKGRVSKQCRLQLSNHLNAGDVSVDLGLVADQTRVTHLRTQLMITSLKILREDSYRQAVEEVHQNDHD